MSAAMLWIGIPLAVAILLWLFQSHRVLTLVIAAAVSLVLMLLAWLLPVDNAILLGPISLEITSTVVILGRRFVLTAGDSRLLVLIYGVGSAWFLAGLVVRVNRFFAPLGLAMIALLVGALAVQPFLYAALLVEMAVLVSVPLLSPPGRPVGKGVLRYLIFQTLAMPFILFAGWVFGGVEINPADQELLVQSVALLGLGFAFWLAVFPLYTWIPLLMAEVSPFTAGFVLSMLPTVVLLLAMHFFNGFPWLWQYPSLGMALRVLGMLMAATGGVWAIFERSLKRLLGYAVIIESGYALLALSLGNMTGLALFATLFLPRLLALLLGSVALSLLAGGSSLTFSSVAGRLRHQPFAALALILAFFSLGGLPLLAGFPARLSLLESLAQEHLLIALWSAVGSLGLVLGGGRALASMVRSQEAWHSEESWSSRIFLTAGSILLLGSGLFPGQVLPMMAGLLAAFERLR